jgi:hypothetical protein
MDIQVPIMIQDPKIATYRDFARIVEKPHVDEGFFLDGPVSKRVAVLDFDPDTGRLMRPVSFQRPSRRRKGRYKIANEENVYKPTFNVYAPDFIAVSVFGTVLRTMYMFEEEDTLGRDLVWAFDGPQLLVVPRAGEWANAFYERDSRSLQFFFFPNPENRRETVYTSLSRDIVSHETGHAILDSIAPHLYDAITPQCLALHEAVADLTAALMAFRSGSLTKAILDETKGSIRESNDFSSIAEEFGMARYELGYLRNLLNEKTLDDVDHDQPHALSQVLSGALYKVVVQMHDDRKVEYSEGDPDRELSVSGKALAVAAAQFKRMIFRALDYLPPGEVSYADYGRAIIAADQASHPDDEQERGWIRDEFVRRKMAPDRAALEVPTMYEYGPLQDVDLDALLESDFVAYQFADSNRKFLHIPRRIPFHVEPRLEVEKLYYHRDGPRQVKECLFKVSWSSIEANRAGFGLPRQRQITVGTTLAIDWDTKLVRALMTSELSGRPREQDDQRGDRDLMLARLADQDVLRFGHLATGPTGKPLRSLIPAESTGDLMRVRGTGRMLHVIGEV